MSIRLRLDVVIGVGIPGLELYILNTNCLDGPETGIGLGPSSAGFGGLL